MNKMLCFVRGGGGWYKKDSDRQVTAGMFLYNVYVIIRKSSETINKTTI